MIVFIFQHNYEISQMGIVFIFQHNYEISQMGISESFSRQVAGKC